MLECLDLYNDVIFYLLYRPEGFYLNKKEYKKFIDTSEKFFRKEYEKWELKDKYSFNTFLQIMKEYKGLFDKFKVEVCEEG